MKESGMGIFEKNLREVEAKAPELAARLRDPALAGVELEVARSGLPTFRYGHRYFHSRYDPLSEAAKQAGELLSKKPDWVALFGLGCGYLLKALVEEGSEKIVVYEPSLEILKGVLMGVDLAGELSREKVFLSTDLDGFISSIRDNIDGDHNLVGYQTTAYRQAFASELVEYTSKVHNAHIVSQVSVSTAISSYLMWIENYFRNIGAFTRYPPASSLLGRFEGIPLIIVGAGPSLRKNAHLLKQAKGRALIIAAVTAYKPLLKYGVIPDFVIAAEKVDLPEYFTYGDEDKKTRFLLGEVSHPNMFKREVLGKFVYFNFYVKLSKAQAALWGSEYFPASGGSVTTCAFDFGRVFGCDPIIMVGQDMSFGSGRTHVDGGVYIDQNVRIDAEAKKIVIEEEYVKPDMTTGTLTNEFELLWLKGLDGKPIPSKFDWVTFHQWFERQMTALRESGSGLKVINATEGGAYIEGMEHISLKEALERHVTEDKPVEEIIRDVETHRPPIDYAGLMGSFTRMKEAVALSGELAARIVKESERLMKKFRKGGMGPSLAGPVSRIREIEREIFDSGGEAEFIWDSLAFQTHQLKDYLRKEKSSDDARQFIKDANTTCEAYRNVRDTCNRFVPMIEEAVETIERFADRPAQGCEGAQEGPGGGAGRG